MHPLRSLTHGAYFGLGAQRQAPNWPFRINRDHEIGHGLSTMLCSWGFGAGQVTSGGVCGIDLANNKWGAVNGASVTWADTPHGAKAPLFVDGGDECVRVLTDWPDVQFDNTVDSRAYAYIYYGILNAGVSGDSYLCTAGSTGSSKDYFTHTVLSDETIRFQFRSAGSSAASAPVTSLAVTVGEPFLVIGTGEVPWNAITEQIHLFTRTAYDTATGTSGGKNQLVTSGPHVSMGCLDRDSFGLGSPSIGFYTGFYRGLLPVGAMAALKDDPFGFLEEPGKVLYFGVAGASAAITGTAGDGATESEIVAGGETIIITLTGDTWVAAGATFDAQRQNIIDGLDSDGVESTGWNAEVRDKEVVGAVVRTSDTVVTITLTAAGAYEITSGEAITVTIPASALVTSGSAVVATPAFTITNETAGSAIPVFMHHYQSMRA